METTLRTSSLRSLMTMLNESNDLGLSVGIVNELERRGFTRFGITQLRKEYSAKRNG